MAEDGAADGDEQALARVPLAPRWLRVGALVLLAAVITYLSFSPAARVPGGPRSFGLGHAVGYAGLSLGLAYALARWRPRPWVKALVVFALTMGYGLAMEVGQLFRPTRTFQLVDLGLNAVGAGVGAAWCLLEPRVGYRRVPGP